MRLLLTLAAKTVVDVDVNKVSAEGVHGCFTLLPKHIDFVTALVPGILGYETPIGREHYVATDDGVLVKEGSTVRIACLNVVCGRPLGELEAAARDLFLAVSEREKLFRAAAARLEADFVRRMAEL